MRIARIFNTYGPRMCIDDGRVVSNFVAQVLLFLFGRFFIYLYSLFSFLLLTYHANNFWIWTGVEEGAIDCLWRRKADKKLSICIRLGKSFSCLIHPSFLTIHKNNGNIHYLANIIQGIIVLFLKHVYVKKKNREQKS